MGHERRHRGAHPEDETLFADSQVAHLRCALHDYCMLLSMGYAPTSSLKLVGDKFKLVDRQRLLLMRSACTSAQQECRHRTRRSPSTLVECDLYLDGFNLLIAVESALSGGFIFIGQDGCYRDLSSVHGTYKRVSETLDAVTLIGETLSALPIRATHWLLDRPVSNSGRLSQILVEMAQQKGWNWQVQLCESPDQELKKVSGTVVSTDSAILDSVDDWFHLNQQVIDLHIPHVRLIDLRQREEPD